MDIFRVTLRLVDFNDVIGRKRETTVDVKADSGFNAEWIVRNKIRRYGLDRHAYGHIEIVRAKKIR